eukprot:1158216-Pelagomonas_calceolata.AAC.10
MSHEATSVREERHMTQQCTSAPLSAHELSCPHIGTHSNAKRPTSRACSSKRSTLQKTNRVHFWGVSKLQLTATHDLRKSLRWQQYC